MEIVDSMPTANKKAIKKAVEAALEKYRIYKYLTFEEREASITASYEERFHGPTNQTSDQTANIAIHNVDAQAARKAYCERIERVVKRLPEKEMFLIQKRYLTEDSQYITDYHVFCFEFDPPISAVTYAKIRDSAFMKLHMVLNL